MSMRQLFLFLMMTILLAACIGLLSGCVDAKAESEKNIRADVAKNSPGATIASLEFVSTDKDDKGQPTLSYRVVSTITAPAPTAPPSATPNGKPITAPPPKAPPSMSVTVLYTMDGKTGAIVSRKMESMQ